MRLPFFGASRLRGVANLSVMSIATVAVVVAAAVSDGYRATNVDLNDGAVWVSNESTGAFGQIARLNMSIDEFDFSIQGLTTPDVIQDGRAVFVGDAGGVQRVVVETGGFAAPKNGIRLADYQIGGGTAALLEAESGKLWTGFATSVVAPEYPKKASARVAPGSMLAVTQSGKVFVVDPSAGVWFEVPLDPQGQPVRPAPLESPASDATAATTTSTTTATAPVEGEELDDLASIEPLEPEVVEPLGNPIEPGTVLTTVGDTLVFLGPDGVVFTADGPAVKVPGATFALQERGPEADAVLVASDEGLFEIQLGSSEAVELSADNGVPARPVRVERCVYGAWAAEVATWFRACPDRPLLSDNVIEGANAASVLVWRVNGTNIALNSTKDGGAWAVQDGRLTSVGNWGDFQGVEADEDSEEADSATDEEADRICVDDLEQPPTALDDPSIGVRNNQQSMIDVLANDSDANCDPIAVSQVTSSDPTFGVLSIVDNGQRVLYAPAQDIFEGARALPLSFSFTYAVKDPSGLESPLVTATVLVTDPDVTNRPPELRKKSDGESRTMRTVVESGKTVRYSVLADWWDPDGDSMRLVGAVDESAQGEVSATPDGIVRYGAFGVQAGVQTVTVRVSDGRPDNDEGSGDLEVTVLSQGQAIKPVAQNDFVTVMVGETASVRPMANDIDGNGIGPDNQLFVVLTTADFAGGNAQYDAPTGLLTVTGVTAGVYPLPYTLSDDTDAATATVQVTVVAPPAENQVPVAVPDQVVVRPGRVVNVDVLTNDIDVDGDILALVSALSPAAVDAEGGVRVSISERRLLQIELVPRIDGTVALGPFYVDYVIDDGRSTTEVSHRSRGQLTVLVDPSTADQPPVPAPDVLVVRTGDVAAVAVLDNDIDPDGDKIELIDVQREVAAQLEEQGAFVAWADGSDVRVRGGVPGTYSLQYSVKANGKEPSGELRIEVRGLPTDTSPNLPPAPRNVEVRAARGAQVRVFVPLTGIDPDGDSVRILGVSATAGATEGTRVSVDTANPGVLLYETEPNSIIARDSFTYLVEDALGQTNQATVDIVVIDVVNAPPVGVDDVIRAKPGRVVLWPVLANDVDADDDRLSLPILPFKGLDGIDRETPLNPDAVAVVADVEGGAVTGGRLEITVPQQDEPAITERYRVTDGANSGDAYVRVIPDPAAPNIAPLTFGFDVPAEVVQQDPNVEVQVLESRGGRDFDPDGDGGSMTVSLPAAAATAGTSATTDGSSIQVVAGDVPQTIVYRVTDSDTDARTSYGVIRVPSLVNNPPALNQEGLNADRSIRIKSDEPSIRFVLGSLLVDPDGDTGFGLTDTEVSAAGTGSIDVSDDRGSFTFAPNASESGYPAQVTFEVEDRPGDDTSERATLTIYFDVDPPGNTAPEVVASGSVNVPQYDEPVRYDLAPLVEDQQNDPLTFTLLRDRPAGFDIRQSNSQLTIISTNPDLQPGASFTLRYTVTDGIDDHVPAEGSLAITVIGTNRAAPIAANIGPIEAVRDSAAPAQNVIAQATNPFPDEPLTIETVSVSGGGSVGCSAACGQSPIVFTPTVPGTFEVTYVLKDTVDRTTTGKITYVVKGRPLAPGVPQIGSVGNAVVNLSWSPADLQGGALKEYRVTAVETGQTKTSTTTALAFDGLENAKTYRFTVVAVNEIGDGVVSAPSNGAIPDRVPDPPQNLRFINYADGTLSLQWDPPATAANYSAITAYEVNLAGFGIVALTSPVTQVSQAGLTNGTNYTFTVRARNAATTGGGWGAFSSASASERPSRFPDAPTAVVAAAAGDGGTPRVRVTWAAPVFDGGRPIDRYQVCRVQDGLCQPGDNTRQVTFTTTAGASNSFRVVAYNSDKNKNDSVASAASNVVLGVVTPGVPTITNVVSGNTTLAVAATAGTNGGCSTSSIQYAINGGPWQASNVFGGLANGAPYTLTARMTLGAGCLVNLGPGASATSAATGGAVQIPYGPLGQPTINSRVSGTSITFTWNANQGTNGRTWTATVTGCDTGWAIGPGQTQTGQCTINPGYSSGPRTATITVTAPGVANTFASISDATGPRPSPSVSIGIGAQVTGETCSDNQGCYRVNITISGGTGGPYAIRCYGRIGGGYLEYASFTAGNGTHSSCAYSYAGRQVYVAVDGTVSGPDNFPVISAGGVLSNPINFWPTD